MTLPCQIVENHLREAREVGAQYHLYDMHVHPFELLLKPIEYTQDHRTPGVLAAGSSNYSMPSVKEIDLAAPTALSDDDPQANRSLSLQARMAYRYAGSRVLTDRMTLSGVGSCMLLPVPKTRGAVEQDHLRVHQLQAADPDRFMYAAGVPGDVTDAPAFLKDIRGQFAPRAVKIHPNFSRVDLGSESGRYWIESMLAAASAVGLPSIVHGGRSILLPQGEMLSYACIDNLLTVDWSASERPVVISHVGAFGCSLEEVKSKVLPGMKKLFARHSHLLADTAGLSYHVLLEILKELGPERILFGSDEMYFPQWRAMALFVHACKSLWNELGQEFISVTHENGANVLEESAVTT